MLKPINFHLKLFFFLTGLLLSVFFLAHNLLLVKHYQVDKQIIALEKEFEKLSLEEKKLNSQKNLEIEQIFEKSRSRLKKQSIKNIPLIEFK